MRRKYKLSLLKNSNKKTNWWRNGNFNKFINRSNKRKLYIIKNEINEWKIFYQKEALLNTILVKIELDMKLFIWKDKETIKRLKIVRKKLNPKIFN